MNENELLERLMKDYKDGKADLDDLIGIMCVSRFLVPIAVYSNNKLLDFRNKNFNDLKNWKNIKMSNLIQKDVNGLSYMVLYTSNSKFKSLPKGYETYEMTLEEIIVEYKNYNYEGIVINPNTDSFSFNRKQICFMDLCIKELKKMV